MIPRLSVAGTACLAFLSGFEQILCFAAAAPAPRIEARPKHYFPRHVKRIVTNGTQSHSQSQTSTSDLEAEKSSLQSEKSTLTPTTTLDQTTSESLSFPLESLLTSLLPAAIVGGIPFIQSSSHSSASPSSADSSSRSFSSIDSNILSLSITPPGIVAPLSKSSFNEPPSSAAASFSSVPVSTASTLSSSFGVAGFQDAAASLSAGTAPKTSGTQSLFAGSETSLVQTVSTRSSSQSFAEPASTTRAPSSSQTSFASGAKLVGEFGVDSSIIKPPEEVSSIPGSASQSAPTTTLSSPKTDATELSASVTAPSKTVSISPETPSLSQSEPVTSSRSGTATRSATEPTRGGPPGETPTASLTQSILPGNSSAETPPKEDKTSHDAGIPESATEISFALFGANTIVFSTSKPSLSSSGISAQFGSTKPVTREQNTITTKSDGVDITASESLPRNTNLPESSELVRSTSNVVGSGGVRTTAALSSIAPEKTTSFKATNVESERSASITRAVNGSAAGIFPGEANTDKRPDRPDRPNGPGRPDLELPGFDDSVTPGSTEPTRVPASSTIETPQRSSSEVSGSGTISVQASASAGASTAEETRAVKRSSEFLFGSGGSFNIGPTAPISAPLQGTTSTAGGTSILQSGDGASDSIRDTASRLATKSRALDGSLTSDIVAARPTITTAGGVVVPIPAVTSEQAKPADPSTSVVPKSDLSDSALLDPDSSTRSVVPEKSVTADSSSSLVSEPPISASSVLRTSVSVSQTISEQSNTPSVTLSEEPRSTPSESESAKPSKFGPDAFALESNKPGTELPEGATATGLGSSKTSNIDAPEATETSRSQSSGSGSASFGSVINSGKESATGAPNGASFTDQSESKTLIIEALPEPTNSNPKSSTLTADLDGSSIVLPTESIKPSLTVQTDSIPKASALTADQDGSPIVSLTESIKPSLTVQTDSIPKASPLTADRDGAPIASLTETIKPSLTVQTDSVPKASALTADQDGSPTPPSSAVDLSLSSKPSSALQTSTFPQKPSEGPSSISSPTRSQPQISVPEVTDIPQSVEPSFTGKVGVSSEKTTQSSDGSPILTPGVTNLPPSNEPSVPTQTDLSTPKVTQKSDSPQTLVPESTDVSPSTEASRAAQTGTATVKAPQINGETEATDVPPLTESSRALETGSSTDKAPLSPVPLVTDSPSSVPLPSVTDVLPAKETSRGAQTDLASEKPASPSGRPDGVSIPGPSSTESSPPTEPPPARQTDSASASETVGGKRPSDALPISISAKTGAASATEDTPPIVISPTSLSSVPPPESVPASQTDKTTPVTAESPVVTTGPATSKDIPVEPSKPITASDNQATFDKFTATSSAGSQTGLPVVIPISASPPVPSSGTLEIVPNTASPAVSLSTEEPAKSVTNLPPVVPPEPSEASIASRPIPVDQSTFTAPATSKDSELPASTGSVPIVIVLPSSALSSETSESATPTPTGGQPPAKATPNDASVTPSVSPAPILIGVSSVLTASPSNPGASGYSSASRPSSTVAPSTDGVIAEPSGVSPSAGGIPTGVPVGSASATTVESAASNPAATASYLSAPAKAKESEASVSPAVSLTSAIQTPNESFPSGTVSAAPSSIQTPKPALGSEATATLGVATPVQGTAQSTGTSGGSTTPEAQPNLVQSTGATALVSGSATETAAIGDRPSSAAVSAIPSSVPNDQGSLKPGSTANVLPPSATVSTPATITPLKESPKTEVIIPSGSNVAVPTATDTLTAQLVGSSILAEPSASMPTDTANFPTGIPSSVPRIISPPNGVPNPPDNTTLCQIGFLYPLNYKFVLAHEQSQRQIFKYLPQGIADGLSIPLENVTMQTLRAYDTTQDLHYITTLALFFIPSQQMDLLSLDLHSPAHQIYNNTNPSVKTIMSMINPAIPLKGDNSLGTPSAPGSGKDDSSTSTDSNPGNEGVPISGVDNSSPVRGKSVGIAAGVVCGAAAYGAAMFFVARRYRKRKQSHRRSPSMLSSPVLSGTSHDYTVVANTALMSGGRGDGDRSLTPHNGYYYERNSRGSGHSGSTGRQQISAPVMAENSLGWN